MGTGLERRSDYGLPGAVAIVGWCAAILIALAGAYYIAAARRVSDDSEHVGVAIAACVVAVPWLMVALAITARRAGVALLMAMSNSTAFLLYVAGMSALTSSYPSEWKAIESLAIAMVMVHMAALGAALFAWRNLSTGERSFDGKAGVVLLPVVVACALAFLASKWGRS